ncbi:MAG: septum formation initiator family protein [Candidatus Levybacteria bacterium]|nr:septum formation initiator family protein [Candidatus Levybacteria bacterium]
MKKILFVVIVAILLVIINNLVRSIYNIWQKKDFVTQAQKELDFQKQENQRLKSQLTYVQTQEFIERQARDKLFMVKKGEQKVLIPQEPEKTASEEKNNLPNWKKWWNLFF